MISRFFTTDPAPLDVRVARVVVPPWPLAAYFLIRAPQVADGVMVPWPEAVTVTLLAAVLVPLWLYWVADLVSWRRERRTTTPSQLELTADLSAHGFFAGDLAALVDAEAHGRAVPPKTHRATNYLLQSQLYAADWAAEQHEKLTAMGAIQLADGETYLCKTGAHAAVERIASAPTDDRPTEPLLLTHEFTPASGVQAYVAEYNHVVDSEPEPVASSRVVGFYESSLATSTGGRHRKREQARPIPPIADVPNAEAYAFLNRSRELGY
jgi:hypothetical protein